MSRTHLDLGQIRVSHTDKKSSPYPYPSDQVTDGFQGTLPSLHDEDEATLVDE
jgi:hypothetical protein